MYVCGHTKLPKFMFANEVTLLLLTDIHWDSKQHTGIIDLFPRSSGNFSFKWIFKTNLKCLLKIKQIYTTIIQKKNYVFFNVNFIILFCTLETCQEKKKNSVLMTKLHKKHIHHLSRKNECTWQIKSSKTIALHKMQNSHLSFLIHSRIYTFLCMCKESLWNS